LLLTTRSGVAVVPAPVVQHGLNGMFAYVVKSDQSVEQRPIKIGYSRDGVTVVEEGLRFDEVVVLDGQYKLRSGTRVQLVPPGGQQRPQVSSVSHRETAP